MKIIKTEVDLATYTRLKHLADRRALPLKAVAREALQSYVESAAREPKTDSLLRIVGRFELPGRNWSECKGWNP